MLMSLGKDLEPDIGLPGRREQAVRTGGDVDIRGGCPETQLTECCGGHSLWLKVEALKV
jgi:hypothetical protein